MSDLKINHISVLAIRALKFVLLFLSSAYLISCKAGGTVEERFTPLTVSNASLSKSYISGGDEMSLSVKDSNSETKIYIGGKECLITSKTTDESTGVSIILCTVPAHTQGVVDIVVEDFRETIMKDAFTYYDPLEIISISQSEGFTYGSYSLTISGKGFQPDMVAALGVSNCTSLVINSVFDATCTVPSADAGLVDVVLTNTNSDTVTLANSFEYKSDFFTKLEVIEGETHPRGYAVGSNSNSRYATPFDVALYNSNQMFVSDTSNNVIKKIDMITGNVSIVVGQQGVPGDVDNSLGISAELSGPTGMVIVGDTLYFSDTNNCRIKKVDLLDSNYPVVAWAGTGTCSGTNGNYVDNGVGLAMKLNLPYGLDSDGTYIYVANSYYHNILRINISALPGPIAEATGQRIAGGTFYYTSSSCSNNTVGTSAKIKSPHDVSYYYDNVALKSYLFVTSSEGFLRRVELSGTFPTTTFSGTCTNIPGFHDPDIGLSETSSAARFNKLSGLSNDGTYLYLSDASNHRMRRVEIANPDNTTTILGSGVIGQVDAVGTAAVMSSPGGQVYENGKIYFSSIGNHSVRILNLSDNSVSTYSGKGSQ